MDNSATAADADRATCGSTGADIAVSDALAQLDSTYHYRLAWTPGVEAATATVDSVSTERILACHLCHA
jgi:hypothetical protein